MAFGEDVLIYLKYGMLFILTNNTAIYFRRASDNCNGYIVQASGLLFSSDKTEIMFKQVNVIASGRYWYSIEGIINI